MTHDIGLENLVAAIDKQMGWNKSMRITVDAWLMGIAAVTAQRATCRRRRVGCVLVNARYQVIGTGYNGNARGLPHCLDHPCPGMGALSGEGLDLCEAIHAEQNAIINCHDANQIHACYSTTEPCVHCAKILMNTPCELVLFLEPYPGHARDLWLKNRPSSTWRQLEGRPGTA
jgi:dCMP deaminase